MHEGIHLAELVTGITLLMLVAALTTIFSKRIKQLPLTIGLVFVAGRAIYAVSYVKDPATRGTGMMLTVLPCWILVLGSLGGAVWKAIS